MTASSSNVYDFNARVSPDGRSMAFIRLAGGVIGDVYMQNLNRDCTPQGQSRRLTFVSAAMQGVAWTADGANILYSAGPFCGLTGIHLLPVRTNWLRRGTARTASPFGEDAVGLSTSAGGRIVYAREFHDTNVWTTELSSDGLREPSLFASSAMVDANPDYSPDGKQIAFSSNRSGYNEL